MGINDHYISGFIIKRPVQTNVNGIATETFSDLSEVNGRMRPLTGNEVLANEKLGLKTSHRFYCDVIDAEERDRIYDSNKIKTYDIKFVKNPMEMDHHFEIDCELLDA